ncbi:MAG: hypothetical protein AAGE52_07370 [Myxococcota bacterium]
MRAIALLLVASGCTPLPDARPARGLYHDLRKAVEFRESDDWVVDSLEIDDALSTVMRSVCSAEPEARETLQIWLASQIDANGGPSEARYREEGGITGSIRETRRLERVRLLLDYAEDHVHECPYWLEADPDFAGVQSDEGRFVVLVETRGGAAVLINEDDTAVGGGGGVRILPAVGITRRLTLALGYEAGADGLLLETMTGSRSFEASLAMAVPLILRITNVSRVVDIEVAGTARFANDDRFGLRVAVGYGLSTPRLSSFMPYGVIWIGYQVLPPAHGLPTEHSVWLGTRVGFDWDP